MFSEEREGEQRQHIEEITAAQGSASVNNTEPASTVQSESQLPVRDRDPASK